MIPRALFLHPLQQCSMSFIALHQKDTAILQISPNHSSVNVDMVLAVKPCLARKVRKWSRLEAFLTCSMWGHSLGESVGTWWWSRLGQILSSADFSCNWAACFFVAANVSSCRASTEVSPWMLGMGMVQDSPMSSAYPMSNVLSKTVFQVNV